MACLPAEIEQPALRLLTTNCPKSTVEGSAADLGLAASAASGWAIPVVLVPAPG